jgi:hypothetical protein
VTDELVPGVLDPSWSRREGCHANDRSRHRRQLHPGRDRHVLRDAGQTRRRGGPFRSPPPAALGRRPRGATQPRPLYSEAVFDLDAGPVQIILPDPGDRVVSLLVLDEDHYVVMVVYGGGRHSLTRDQVGTRYVLPRFVSWSTQRSPGRRTGAWLAGSAHRQPANLRQLRGPELGSGQPEEGPRRARGLGSTLTDLRGGGGSREEVDPVRHLIATAAGWGLIPTGTPST